MEREEANPRKNNFLRVGLVAVCSGGLGYGLYCLVNDTASSTDIIKGLDNLVYSGICLIGLKKSLEYKTE